MQCFSIFCVPGLVMTTILMAAGFTAIPAHAVEQTGQAAITEGEVNAAQQAWCDELLKIGKIARNGGDYRAAAAEIFKPTLASGKNTFRPTREGAISYFVGGNREFPEDSGFALKNWAMVRYDNNASENGIQIFGNIAITMGNMYFTNTKGEQVMVDKTFVFRKGKDGKLRLCVHKSALPFDPAK